MSDGAAWPNGARGALSLTFDNLGEAAEIEMGAIPADADLGRHATVAEVLPSLLGRLEERELAATFFVEGLNADTYPDALERIAAGGHEVSYHAWRHEQWADLSAEEQSENLQRGLAGFGKLGIEMAGLRPPGGQLGPGGLTVLREAGLRYCSPAGAGAGEEDGIALLPFQWRHLDAGCVLPPLAGVREQMTGSPDPVEPADFVASLAADFERLGETGGYVASVLHPFMLGWLGDDPLDRLLDRVAELSRRGDIWVATCAAAADHVLARPDRFRGGTALDSTSWAG